MDKYSLATIFLLFFAVAGISQVPDQGNVCNQPREVREALIDEATRTEFNVRRVEIVGSTYIRHREFSKRMPPGMHEGDIFSRAAIEISVKRIARMRAIYPITMDDVEIRLDRAYKDVDVVICVRQKPKR